MNHLIYKTSFISLAFLISISVFSQPSLNIGVSRNYSTFSFKDSIGNKDKSYSKSGANGFSAGIHHTLASGFTGAVSFGIRDCETSLDFEGIAVDWSLQYFFGHVSVGYRYQKHRIQPYLLAGPYFASLVKARQKIGVSEYDLVKLKAIKTGDMGLFINPGIKFVLSDYFSVFGEYQSVIGLQNIEKTGGQKTNNRGFAVNVGMVFAITGFEKKSGRSTEAKSKQIDRSPEVDDALRHLRGIINKQ